MLLVYLAIIVSFIYNVIKKKNIKLNIIIICFISLVSFLINISYLTMSDNLEFGINKLPMIIFSIIICIISIQLLIECIEKRKHILTRYNKVYINPIYWIFVYS